MEEPAYKTLKRRCYYAQDLNILYDLKSSQKLFEDVEVFNKFENQIVKQKRDCCVQIYCGGKLVKQIYDF